MSVSVPGAVFICAAAAAAPLAAALTSPCALCRLPGPCTPAPLHPAVLTPAFFVAGATYLLAPQAAPANGNGNQSPKLQGSDRQESLQNQLISDQQQQLLERDGTALPNGERGRPPACIAACFQLVAFNSMLDSLCCLHMTRWPMPHPPARPPAQPCLLQATPPSPSSLSTASFVS